MNLLRGQKLVQFNEAQRLDELLALGLIEIKSGTAIDGGAHVGSWTVKMADHFDAVLAFEPCAESFEMLKANVYADTVPGSVELYCRALMDKDCMVRVEAPGRQTLTARQVNYGGDVHGITIDGLNLTGCDFIKLDLEGSEPLAIIGAKETLKKFKPFLVIEFNPNLADRFEQTPKSMLIMLKALGYKKVWENDVDWGFKWIQQ